MLGVLQKREVFHLAFLRILARSVPPDTFVVKGGSNLRFFFGSIRYSEDMDLDAGASPRRSWGGGSWWRCVRRLWRRRCGPAAGTGFEVHLLTSADEDLSTKVEFSRLSFDSPFRTESVSRALLATYRMPPLLVSHYTGEAAIREKVRALVSGRQPEARIFAIEYSQFRDGVVAFLSPEDRPAHDSSRVWDEICLRAIALLEGGPRREG